MCTSISNLVCDISERSVGHLEFHLLLPHLTSPQVHKKTGGGGTTHFVSSLQWVNCSNHNLTLKLLNFKMSSDLIKEVWDKFKTIILHFFAIKVNSMNFSLPRTSDTSKTFEKLTSIDIYVLNGSSLLVTDKWSSVLEWSTLVIKRSWMVDGKTYIFTHTNFAELFLICIWKAFW